jgi:hypothetical protein
VAVAQAVLCIARVRVLDEGVRLLRAALDLPARDPAKAPKELLHLVIPKVRREVAAVDGHRRVAGHGADAENARNTAFDASSANMRNRKINFVYVSF